MTPEKIVTNAIRAFPFWNYGMDDVDPCHKYAEWVPDLAAAIVAALAAEATLTTPPEETT